MKRSTDIIGLFVALFFVLFAFACEKMDMASKSGQTKGETQASEEQASEGAGPEVATEVSVASIVIGSTPFSVEIATTDEERAKGLMGRESLPKGSGMWFVFPQSGQEKFWMKDTLIPLDLIFVDENMKVVHIIENASPGSTELLSSPEPYMYVLEVNAGEVATHGIKVGASAEKRLGLE